MTVRCVDCAKGAMRVPSNAQRDLQLRRMAAQGFINCTASDMKSLFQAPLAKRECGRFTPADSKTAATRESYFKKPT